MAECIVSCPDCRAEDGGQRRWRFLCEECAEEKLWEHKLLGHEPFMVVTREPTMDDLRQQIRDARVRGW